MARGLGWYMRFLGALGLLVLGARGVEAASISFDECPSGCTDDPPMVTVSGFDVQVPDVLVAPEVGGVGLNTPGVLTTSAPDFVSPILAALLLKNAVTREISDIVELTFVVSGGVAQVTAIFLSDSPGFSFGDLPLGFPALVETDGLQDLSGIFFDTTNGALVSLPPELMILARSNVPEPAAVPEPATWLLLATGLVGLLGYGWRQRKKTV